MTLRRDIPEPESSTSLSQFLKQIDSKTAIWQEMAARQSRPYQAYRQNVPPPQRAIEAPQQQRNQPLSQQRRIEYGKQFDKNFAPRLPINDGKAHAFLAEVTPDGYRVYEDEQGHEHYVPEDELANSG